MSPEAWSDLTVSRIRAHIEALPDLDEPMLCALEADHRAGVRAIAARARARRKTEARERARLQTMCALENTLRARGFIHIAGIDEAGRGPLAGPVVAAAVILPPNALITGLNDSKALSAQRRETLFDDIHKTATCVAVAQAEAGEIDRINIRNATHLAMRRAIEALAIKPDKVLVDGNALPESPFPEQAVIGGDRSSLSIAAASIIAKVTRDRLMLTYDRQFPAYGFAKHKGYGSAEHLNALQQHGPSPIHRLSFGGVPAPEVTRSEDFAIFAEGIQTAQNPAQLEAIGQSIAQAGSQMQPGETLALRDLYRQRSQALLRTGPTGERLASEHLKNKGFAILETRFRAAGGEIDLIARKDQVLAFVEVKTAGTDLFGPPESWVTPQKQAQIIRVARAYLHRHPNTSGARFDVIAIRLSGEQVDIRHIEGAFSAPG